MKKHKPPELPKGAKILTQGTLDGLSYVIFSDPSPPSARHLSAISPERLAKQFTQDSWYKDS